MFAFLLIIVALGIILYVGVMVGTFLILKSADPLHRTSRKVDKSWYRNVYLQSKHWRDYRLRRIARAGYQCEAVGCNEHGDGLDVHHLTYARIGHERMSDTLVLCRNHHNRIERGEVLTIRN